MEAPPSVLLVDDEPPARDAVATAIGDAIPPATTVTVDGVESARERLDAVEVDAVVTGYDLPDGTGIELLERVRTRDRGLPVVLYTGSGDESVASRAIAAGVTDYVPKGSGGGPERVAAAIGDALESPGAPDPTGAATGPDGATVGVDGTLPTVVELVGDPVYVLDGEGYLQSVNEAFEATFGYDRGELIGSHLTTYVDEETYESGTEALLDVAASTDRAHLEFEFTGETADGTETVAAVTATPLSDGDRLLGSVGTLRDVTERRRRERSLETYRTLVETVSDPMFELDADGEVEMVNDAMVEFLGYDRGELTDLHFGDFLDPDESDAAQELVRDLLSEDGDDTAVHEFSSTTKSGEKRVVEDSLTVLTDDSGRYTGSVGVLRDVTERKARERELRQYEKLMETVAVGMFTVDHRGVLRWANEECYRLLGLSADRFEREYVDEHFMNLVHDGFFDPELVEQYTEYVREMLSSDTDTRKAIQDVTVHRPDGSRRFVDSHHGVLPLEDGEYRGTVTAFRDITKQKQYERELERQNERLERFASVVSHDLRNPLTVAQGHLGVAKTAADPTEAIEEVEVSLDRMQELIEDVLALARQGRSVGEPTPTSLAAVAEQARDTVDTTAARVRIETDATIVADESRVQQLLENCFRNSVEHGSTSGQRADAPDVTITVRDIPGGFAVEDDGPGIPDDEKGEVFELGYTTDPTGTGFGLGIVSEIVDAHGWAVTIADGDRGGARFEVTGVDRAEQAASGE